MATAFLSRKSEAVRLREMSRTAKSEVYEKQTPKRRLTDSSTSTPQLQTRLSTHKMATRLKPYDFLMAVRALPKKMARSLPKSESSKTLVESAANKRGLSKMLDGTLREGAHDMRYVAIKFCF